ncbi:MAG: HAMP domain-containing sensor histidine kinase [Sulfuricurvum sp.]|nr:HAMP domain-containing sensor histidine kinase [Sulfuricurvum sp.]MDP3023265.1 HAMP domain-containing sensor histidine kinase [Sulfuricurvum sp.]MDP3119675.1 HAMP domain-containing sensor histidine kinase [Sulfuricurvum sp.]
MKHAETESFRKSFLVFFLSLALLSGFLAYFEYLKQKQALDATLFNQMKLCSFDLKCSQFEFDFVPLQSSKLYTLTSEPQGLYALFSIPKNDTYALKLRFAQKHYAQRLYEIQIMILKYYLLSIAAMALLSFLFSLYALYPLRKALKLTEEFSRDILHDLNTPLSSLRLNVSRLSVAEGERKKIERIEYSIQAIASLGNNLRSYLDGHELQQEKIELFSLLQERVSIVKRLYPDITFHLDGSSLAIHTNRDAIIRIFDNLLSNAAKYNNAHGCVWINTSGSTIVIHDNGKGIKNTTKIFDRFYKEHDRGLGIGLHIVKKLCDAIHISIEVQSTLGKGTRFALNFKALMDH